MVAVLGLWSGTGAMAADAGRGKELFITCAACHTEKPDAIGPDLKGVFGRKSAALEDFRYSNPMKRANLVWDAANLRAYLIDPQAKVKGNRMPFGGVAESGGGRRYRRLSANLQVRTPLRSPPASEVAIAAAVATATNVQRITLSSGDGKRSDPRPAEIAVATVCDRRSNRPISCLDRD